jgi:hypothetical protein
VKELLSLVIVGCDAVSTQPNYKGREYTHATNDSVDDVSFRPGHCANRK